MHSSTHVKCVTNVGTAVVFSCRGKAHNCNATTNPTRRVDRIKGQEPVGTPSGGRRQQRQRQTTATTTLQLLQRTTTTTNDGDEQRTTNDERRTTNDERRTTNDEQRTTNDERRTKRAKMEPRAKNRQRTTAKTNTQLSGPPCSPHVIPSPLVLVPT